MRNDLRLLMLMYMCLAAFWPASIQGGEEERGDGYIPVSFGAALDTPAGSEERRFYPVSFWEIGISRFHAQIPRPIALPKRTGEPAVYWYWPFQFDVITNLDDAKAFIEDMMPKLQSEQDKEYYREHLKRIERTLNQPRRIRLFIVCHTDTGQILTDMANSEMRNLVERKIIKGNLQTCLEISQRELQPGETVRGVAIFPNIEPAVKYFEIRVYGLGKRIVPSYEPGELLCHDNIFDATMRRALRFSYHRYGNTSEHLDAVEERERKADWIWLWPTQIFAGRFRSIVIDDRDTGLRDEAGSPIVLRREYRYVPYKVWNNTSMPQSLDILKAGIYVDVVWRGERLRLRMPDIGEPDDFWKTQVDRHIRASVAEGKEKELVMKHEIMEKVLEEFQKAIDNPALPERHQESAKKSVEAILADAAAKADILSPRGPRHFHGILQPAEQVKGLIIVRWTVDDLPGIVARLADSLRSRAIAGAKEEENSEMLKAYIAIRPQPPADYPPKLRLPEPDRAAVEDLLIRLAEEDLKAQFPEQAEPPDDSKRLYGKLAPIGHLLNLLATAAAQKRADESSVVDVYFEARWDGVFDRASFPCNFKRVLPVVEHEVYRYKAIKPYQRTEAVLGIGAAPSRPKRKAVEAEERKEEPKEEKPKEEKKEADPWGG